MPTSINIVINTPTTKHDKSTTQDKLQRILRIAAAHPLYGSATGGASELNQWPMLQKSDLHSKFASLQENMPRSYWSGIYWSPSGGTTSVDGLPTFFPTDVKENHLQRRILSERMGGLDGYDACQILSPDIVALNLYSGSDMYRAMEISTEQCDWAGATSLPASFECSDDKAAKLATRFSANALFGAPPRLMQFAMSVQAQRKEQQQEQQPRLQIDRIFWACEPLQASKKKLLQDTFGVKHFNSVYGSAESGVWAFQPDWLEEGAFLFFPDMMKVEIVNPEEDGTGLIVVTNLIRERFPLIRYRMGDVGRLEVREHAGKQWHVLILKGREPQQFMIGSDYFLLTEVESAWMDAGSGSYVLEWQCVLTADASTGIDTVTVCIVANDSQADSTLAATVQQNLVESMHPGIEFGIKVRIIQGNELLRAAGSTKIRKIVDQRK